MKQEEINYKTKQKLAKALKKLMMKKPISKITVTEITDYCDLNRKTFYYHFIDIYDLFEWSLQEDAINIIKNFDLSTDFKDVVLFVMDYVEKNKQIINSTIDNISINYIKNFFTNNFHGYIFNYIKMIVKNNNYIISDSFIEFLSSSFTSLIASSIYDWMIHIDTVDKEKAVNYTIFIFNISIKNILVEANNIL